MLKLLNIEFEKIIRLLAKHFPISNGGTRKPVLSHALRDGVYLYERSYSREVILAGLLHDTLEFSKIKRSTLVKEFGSKVAELVQASTKDDSITDKQEKTTELIKRCAKTGQDALIVKAADIIDNFKYYSKESNGEQLQYCLRNANAILKYKPTAFKDKIFIELKDWQNKFA